MTACARRVPLFLAVLLAWCLVMPAPAQTVTGTIQGTVVDTSGGVLPGAVVLVRSLDTGARRETVANDVGFYGFPFLPLGRYRVEASLPGFGTVVREPIQVTLNDTRVVDFTLDPRVSETVTVTAEPPRINAVNAELKNSLDAQQIEDKPTANPGSFLSLAEPFSGFMENPTSGQNNPTLSSGSSVNFGASGTRGTTFQINGVNNDDSSENQQRQGVSLATIKEFQVITNGLSAEFGRGNGAVVLVQTKSGTNQIHGEGYGFFQDSRFNARSFYALTKPENERQQGGGTLGFPFLKDKLFGFFSYDRTRSQGQSSYARDIFNADDLARPRLTRGNDTPENRAFIESVLARFPKVTPNDPRSNRTYATNLQFSYPDEDLSGRIDWNARQGDTAYLRYQYTRQKRRPEDVIIGEQAYQNNRQVNLGLTWTHVFAKSTVGEFRYGLGTRSTRVDISAGNDTPIIRFTGSPVSGSIIGNAGNYPIARDQKDHQFVYNLSTVLWTKHSLKAGTDIRIQALNDNADNFNRGFWTFTTSCGGVTYPTPYAAFLDGCVTSFQKAYGPAFLENRMGEYNLYAEDSWRITNDLTINLGVRYEYVKAPSEKEDRITYGFGDDKNNWEPRVGAAWTPSFETGWLGWLTGTPGDLSLRGGYGIMHGRLFQSVFSQSGASIRYNPPNALSRTVSTLPGQLNISDPSLGFVFTPGLPTARYTLTLVNPDLEVPYTHKWNVTLERKLPWNSTLRLTYAGERGIGLVKYSLDNLPQSPLAGPVTVANHPNNAPAAGFPDLRGRVIDRIAADVVCAGTGLPGIAVNATCPNVVPIGDNEISYRVPRTNERRPDPRYGTNLVVDNDADSWYQSFQVEWAKRVTQGLQFTAQYTWSRTEDTTSEATAVGAGDTNQNGPDKKFARGFSRFHTPHRFTFNGTWRIPFFADRKDLVGQALGGWQLAAFVRLAHGTPFTVVDTGGPDLNFDGFSEGRPVILDRSILGNSVNDPATSQQQLPLTAFRRAVYGDTDIVGRNTFFLDGTKNVDLGIYKTFSLPYGHSMTVRVEMFNAFNWAQFGFPQNNINVANFGRVNTTATTYSPRVVQFAVRYRF